MLVKFGECWFDLVMSILFAFFFISLCCCAYDGHFNYR